MSFRRQIGIGFVAIAVAGSTAAAPGCVGSEPQVQTAADGGSADATSDQSVPDGSNDANPNVDAADAADTSACSACDGATCFEGVCGGDAVVDISAGANRGTSCVALASGSVWCWGDGQYGQLGVAPTTLTTCASSISCSYTPVEVAGATNVVQVASGGTVCARTTSGDVYCWGSNANGQLGHVVGQGDSMCGQTYCSWTPQKVDGVANVVQIDVGEDTACARTQSGDVYCWGDDENFADGQRNTTRADLHAATLVPGLPSDIADIHVLGGQACATSTSQGVYCWGFNEFGELGHAPGGGSPADLPAPDNNAYYANSTPQLVANTAGAITTATAQGVTCALRGDGTVQCFGDNGVGEFADGTLSAASPTATTSALTAVAQISSHDNNAVAFCAVTNQNAVKCWGVAEFGEMGNGFDSTSDAGLPPFCSGIGYCYSTAQSVSGLDAMKVSVGGGYALALGTNGRVYGWGRNDLGQTGHPPDTDGDHSCTEVISGMSPCNPKATLVAGLP